MQNFLALAEDGRAVAWASIGAYADPVAPGGGSMSAYMARRGPGGWKAVNMEPPANETSRPGLNSQLGAFSFVGDLSSEIVISIQQLNGVQDDDDEMDVYRLRSGQQAELLSHGVAGIRRGPVRSPARRPLP